MNRQGSSTNQVKREHLKNVKLGNIISNYQTKKENYRI